MSISRPQRSVDEQDDVDAIERLQALPDDFNASQRLVALALADYGEATISDLMESGLCYRSVREAVHDLEDHDWAAEVPNPGTQTKLYRWTGDGRVSDV